VLRAGVGPGQLPAFLAAVEPALAEAPFVADAAAGLLYLRGAPDVAAVRRAAQERGGYAVVLAAPPAGVVERWGPAPGGVELMQTLKARWDPQGRLNPGAFLAWR
jgi:FAD/FMN-containing dehydrogenase